VRRPSSALFGIPSVVQMGKRTVIEADAGLRTHNLRISHQERWRGRGNHADSLRRSTCRFCRWDMTIEGERNGLRIETGEPLDARFELGVGNRSQCYQGELLISLATRFFSLLKRILRWPTADFGKQYLAFLNCVVTMSSCSGLNSYKFRSNCEWDWLWSR